MKNKTKLLVASVAMVAAVSAGLGTATYAWFTTVRTAEVTLNEITAVQAEGNLDVALVAKEGFTPTTEGNKHTIATTQSLEDISGNGLNLYNPIWKSGETEGTLANSIETATVDKDYVEFQLTLTNTGTATMNVYLELGTGITAKTEETKDVNAAASARFAILNEGKNELKHVSAQKETVDDATYNYVAAKEGQTAYGVAGYELADLKAETKFNNKEYNEVTTSNPAESAQNPLVSTLTDNASETLTVRIWIEGADEDCTNNALEGKFSVKLNMIGVTAA